MSNELERQVTINTNNVEWMRENLKEVKNGIKRITRLLFGILVTLVGALVGGVFTILTVI